LQEVVQKVVLGNPEVLSKWHTFKSSSGRSRCGKGGLFAQDRLHLRQRTGILEAARVADQNFTRGGHTLTLNQMLYDGFATSSDVKRLDKARLTRYFELVDAAENAALEAGRAYYDVMRYRLLLLLAESNYVEHRASYEQLLRRAQSGAGRRVDVEHAASRLALAELNLNTEAANLARRHGPLHSPGWRGAAACSVSAVRIVDGFSCQRTRCPETGLPAEPGVARRRREPGIRPARCRVEAGRTFSPARPADAQ
jgi:hypothetical protein